ncbi:hypothetical protein ADK52_37175 [Streptomyces sp. WM6372]|uniref:hypothetical protein n=1 Tax=Streptomyces sp. WM6372 TaxID=1415555 RepID=UPI0006ADCB8A|nr:hypothetical protein [Streptomyces sp. WM6372]KOU14106.1 hypothetical protein ADK52_37175 [Streptomyces sp. WM6372]
MTAIDGLHPTTTAHHTERPVPPWASITAHAIPLLLLPQCLWRLPFAFGFEMGLDADGAMPSSLWVSVPYVFGLSLITEGLALLSLGLVRGWGEVAPAWLPFIGGKRIAPFAAIIPASLGGLSATVFWAPVLLSWFGVGDAAGFSSGGWQILARLCIAPGMLWGPLVLVLTYAYYTRRCRPAKQPGHRGGSTAA